MKKKDIYTFEDWLENNFWNEEGYSGLLMVNDSENYLDLVSMGKMTYETLNKIQDAQSETYKYIVFNTLETNKKFLQRTNDNSLDFDKYLGYLIEKIEHDLEKNKDLYFEVIRPKLYRGIKYGAKFLLPEEFKKFENHEFIDGYLPVFVPYSIVENGQMKHFPEDGQRKFLRMEIQFYWLNYLRELQKGLKIEPVKAQPNFANNSRTKEKILEILAAMDKLGWNYAFVSEQDFNLFTELLTNFFEYKPYSLPEKVIQLKRTCKTKIAKALGEMHKELSNENKLKTDNEFFKIIRVLNHFENEKEGDLYKALTR